MEKFCYYKALDLIGVNYLGNVATSAKIKKSLKNGTMTYCVYLAPYNMAGTINGKQINVCPNGEHCHAVCLNNSGRNKADILIHGAEKSIINNARIKKTRFFYQDRETFMQVLIHEIRKAQRKAKRLNYDFSVRLNGTSDISPDAFKYNGLSILDIFPEVMFYDYSKRPRAMKENFAHDNYDVTFSFDGYNFDRCEEYLKMGGNVAVVFFGDTLPKTFKGYKVIDGNVDDTRYMDEKGVIVGLHYHVTANDYYRNETTNKREFHAPKTKFVVLPEDDGWNQ